MSAFLGHIHYWLYRKIQLLVERENLILEKTSKVVDDLAEELHSISVDTYGEPINPSIPLENIIDHGNIHSWLANQINIASVREAAFIKDMLDTNSGDEAVHVVTAILDAFARRHPPRAEAGARRRRTQRQRATRCERGARRGRRGLHSAPVRARQPRRARRGNALATRHSGYGSGSRQPSRRADWRPQAGMSRALRG